MTISIVPADAVLTASAASVFTTGTGTQYVILTASVTNTDSTPHTVTTYRVPAGGTAGVTNIIGADAVSVGAGLTANLQLSGQGLVNGQMLQALASTATVVNFNLTLAQVA